MFLFNSFYLSKETFAVKRKNKRAEAFHWKGSLLLTEARLEEDAHHML